MKLKLYHGSQVRDFVPTFGLGNEACDYGRGFYTTPDKELAKSWSVGQQAQSDGWLHVYEVDFTNIKVFDFADVGVLAWLAELMKHRCADTTPSYQRDVSRFICKYGIDLSDYDVIKGWRADASYFFIARMFVRNQIDVSILKRLLKLGDFGIQYFFKSEHSFSILKELNDEKEIVPFQEYKMRFNERDSKARQEMRKMVYDLDKNPLSRVFSDLLKE